MAEIGRRISRMRKERNWTQLELADKLGISYQAVSNWERGNSMPDIEKLPELADLFQCSIDEILGRKAPLIESAIENDVGEYVQGHKISAEEWSDAMPLLKPEQVDRIVKTVMPERLARVKERLREMEDTLHEKLDKRFGSDMADAISDAAKRAIPDAGLFTAQGEEAEAMADGAAAAMDHAFHENPDQVIAPKAESTMESAEWFGDMHLEAMLPFMKSKDVQTFAREYEMAGRSVAAFLPFLEEEEVARLAQKAVDEGKSVALYLPFLNEEDVENFAQKAAQRGENIREYLPFLREETVYGCAKAALQADQSPADYLPFMGEGMIRECVSMAWERGESMAEYLPFLKEELVMEMAKNSIESGKSAVMYLPFLSQENVAECARMTMEKGGKIDAFMPFLSSDDIYAAAMRKMRETLREFRQKRDEEDA